jgi:nickel-dependent lactate racemase
LNNPIEKEPLKQFIKKVKKLLIIVNDATRPTPTWKILDHIYPVLSSLQEVKFLIATGNHRAPTEDEYQIIFGRMYDAFKDQIFVHDAKKQEDMAYLGESNGKRTGKRSGYRKY